MTSRRLATFLSDRRGVAAVEFALILPVIGLMALASLGVWRHAGDLQEARSALNVGANYYMAGGASDSYATTLITAEWKDAPPGASVAANRVCRCGETVIACTATCAAGKPPETFIELAATAPASANGEGAAINEQLVLRVR